MSKSTGMDTGQPAGPPGESPWPDVLYGGAREGEDGIGAAPPVQIRVSFFLSAEEARALDDMPGNIAMAVRRIVRAHLVGTTDTAFLRFRRGLWTLAEVAVTSAREAHAKGRTGGCFYCDALITPSLDPTDHHEGCPARLASGQLADFGLWPTGGPRGDDPAAPKGSHVYLDTREREECLHGCGCWLDPAHADKKGGPEGIDPYGACPKARPITYPRRAFMREG